MSVIAVKISVCMVIEIGNYVPMPNSVIPSTACTACTGCANNAAELIRRTQIEALSYLLIDQSSNPLNCDTIIYCVVLCGDPTGGPDVVNM